MIPTIETDKETNFPHWRKFVIQGHSATGWQDSRHGADTPEEAARFAEENAHKIAMPNTRLRVVRGKE
jgi:hypothetical protein